MFWVGWGWGVWCSKNRTYTSQGYFPPSIPPKCVPNSRHLENGSVAKPAKEWVTTHPLPSPLLPRTVAPSQTRRHPPETVTTPSTPACARIFSWFAWETRKIEQNTFESTLRELETRNSGARFARAWSLCACVFIKKNLFFFWIGIFRYIRALKISFFSAVWYF